MRMWVVGLALVMGLVVGSLVTKQVSAQATLQDYTFVVDNAGDTWLILRTGPSTLVRVGVPIFPAADADIAAVPATGQWLIPGDGARVSSDRPSWSLHRPATQQQPPVASLIDIQAAVLAAATPTAVVPPPPAAQDPAPVVAAAAPPAPPLQDLAPAAPALVSGGFSAQAPAPTSTPVAVATATPATNPSFPSATFTPLPLQNLAATDPVAQPGSVVLNALSYEQEDSLVYKGRGGKDTPRFGLKGGNYTIRWQARVTSKTDSACNFIGRFKNAATGGTVSSFANKRNITTSREERERLEAVPAGSTYFFEVDSGCEWEIEIERS